MNINDFEIGKQILRANPNNSYNYIAYNYKNNGIRLEFNEIREYYNHIPEYYSTISLYKPDKNDSEYLFKDITKFSVEPSNLTEILAENVSKQAISVPRSIKAYEEKNVTLIDPDTKNIRDVTISPDEDAKYLVLSNIVYVFKDTHDINERVLGTGSVYRDKILTKIIFTNNKLIVEDYRDQSTTIFNIESKKFEKYARIKYEDIEVRCEGIHTKESEERDYGYLFVLPRIERKITYGKNNKIELTRKDDDNFKVQPDCLTKSFGYISYNESKFNITDSIENNIIHVFYPIVYTNILGATYVDNDKYKVFVYDEYNYYKNTSDEKSRLYFEYLKRTYCYIPIDKIIDVLKSIN